MSTSAHDYGFNEKDGTRGGRPPHMMDETPISRGVRTHSVDDEENIRRGSHSDSRKHSVVASLKANYGLAEAPPYAESIKVRTS
jgi:hypothetical protein